MYTDSGMVIISKDEEFGADSIYMIYRGEVLDLNMNGYFYQQFDIYFYDVDSNGTDELMLSYYGEGIYDVRLVRFEPFEMIEFEEPTVEELYSMFVSDLYISDIEVVQGEEILVTYVVEDYYGNSYIGYERDSNTGYWWNSLDSTEFAPNDTEEYSLFFEPDVYTSINIVSRNTGEIDGSIRCRGNYKYSGICGNKWGWLGELSVDYVYDVASDSYVCARAEICLGREGGDEDSRWVGLKSVLDSLCIHIDLAGK